MFVYFKFYRVTIVLFRVQKMKQINTKSWLDNLFEFSHIRHEQARISVLEFDTKQSSLSSANATNKTKHAHHANSAEDGRKVQGLLPFSTFSAVVIVRHEKLSCFTHL